MNALQVFPNLIGLIGLSGIVAAIARATESPQVDGDRPSAFAS